MNLILLLIESTSQMIIYQTYYYCCDLKRLIGTIWRTLCVFVQLLWNWLWAFQSPSIATLGRCWISGSFWTNTHFLVNLDNILVLFWTGSCMQNKPLKIFTFILLCLDSLDWMPMTDIHVHRQIFWQWKAPSPSSSSSSSSLS